MIGSGSRVQSFAAVVVYAAGLLAGSLHHHGHDTHVASHTASSALCVHSDSSEHACCADADACTVCAAIQLAKAAPPSVVVMAGSVPIRELACVPGFQSPVPFIISFEARGPPLL